MRNTILNRLLLIGFFGLTISSCDKEDSTSMIASFEKYPLVIDTPAATTDEGDEDVLTFDFSLDDKKQITDLLIEVSVASASTATEGVDFELSAHEFEVAAFEGQDGFSLDIAILQDFEIEDEDETIYLTFSTTTPSGLTKQEVKLVTIKDSGLVPQPAETVDFTLRWGFTDSLLSQTKDICEFGFDVDMTFQTAGTAEYDDDLMGYDAASTDCPEEGELTVADMVDGEAYDVWVLLYGGLDFGDLSGMTIYIDYDRANSDFHGTYAIEDVFNTKMTHNGGPMLTIQRNGDVLTLKDGDGDVISSGRVKAKSKVSKLRSVTKRK